MPYIKDFKSILEYSLDDLIDEAENENINSITTHIGDADDGDDNAYCYIGMAYYHFKKYYKAMAWFIMASKRGNAEAQRKLGVMFQEGFGVNIDESVALVWFTRSAVNGCAKAHNNIRHLNNLGFVLEDTQRAMIESEQDLISTVSNNMERIEYLENENIELKESLENLSQNFQKLLERVVDLEDEVGNWSDDDPEY